MALSEEHRKKISEKLKGRKRSETHCEIRGDKTGHQTQKTLLVFSASGCGFLPVAV